MITVMNQSKVNTFILNELEILNGHCCYCGRKMNDIVGHKYQYTIDHVYPRSNGGTNHPLNRLPCCRTCNLMKANHSLQYFLEQVEWRLKANIGGSKCSAKRWKHTHSHIVLVLLAMPKYKKEIFSHPKKHLQIQ